MLGKIAWRLGLNSIHALGTWALLNDPWFQWADVIHLHNLHGEAFSYLALPALAKRKPLVWTLHDMWALTGHCGFSLGCNRWRTGCGRCPHLDVYPCAARDATRWEWKWKRRAIGLARPAIAAPSRWLCRLAGEAFPGLAPAHHVPYSINTQVFQPASPSDARRALGLPEDRMLLLSAASDLTEQRKGGHLLADALRRIPDDALRRIGLVMLGDGRSPWLAELQARGTPVFALGYLDDPARQARVYSGADLLLFPSMDDNLPIVVLEALACGLPVLAFAVGGLPELITSPGHGRVIAAFDTVDYAAALEAAIRSWPGIPSGRGSLLPADSEPAREAAAYARLYHAVLTLGLRS
jgi:glycosyltransferase involved in cell wall biosynthesis